MIKCEATSKYKNTKVRKYKIQKYVYTKIQNEQVFGWLHLQLRLRLASSPHPQIISTGGQEVRIDTLSMFRHKKFPWEIFESWVLMLSQRIGGRPCCQGSTWSWWWGRGGRRWTWRWTLKCLRPGWRYYIKCRRLSQLVYRQWMSKPHLTTWTLLLYSSTKEPRANLNLLSGLTDQFMLNTVHGASYLGKWL